MELDQRQKRSLLILAVIFAVSSSIVAIELVSSSSVDWMYLLLALTGLIGSLEIIVRAKTNHSLSRSTGRRVRVTVVVLLVGLLEIVASFVLRNTVAVSSQVASVIVVGGAVVIGVPAVLYVLAGGRENTHRSDH